MTTRLHLPHPHIADHVAEAFERAFHAWPHHHEPPARTVPVAADWDDWHYEPALVVWEVEQ